MAFSVARIFSSVAGRMVTQCRHTTPATVASKCLLSIQKECQMSRPFTRSIWYLCNHSSRDSSSSGHAGGGDVRHILAKATQLRGPGKLCSCGCAGMHTKGDDELAEYLENEIKLEKDSRQFPIVPDIPDFKLTQEYAVATLTKVSNGETVKVTFNLNHSVEEEHQSEEAEQEGEAASRLRSYPEFNVEITKDTQSSLSVGCRFDVSEELDEVGADPGSEDLFIIDEVCIHDGKMDEGTFSVGSEIMDGNLYNFLLNSLKERGINDEFVEKLSDVASALEHKLYIDFLQKLQGIAKF